MSVGIDDGAVNCVIDCAGARRGSRLFVVNETGAVEEPVVAAIAKAGRTAGAEVDILWADPIPEGNAEAIPESVLAAYGKGDIVVSHFPSLSREALHRHFPGETRVRVPNRARTQALLESDWARFPYSVQRDIAERLEARMAAGLRWQITSPSGTEVWGVFGESGGEVGNAYFVDAGEEGRARRNFPGGVHAPRACASLEGVIAVEYMDHVCQSPSEPPLLIEVKDNRVVGIAGGDGEGDAATAIRASDGWIDSWHAGVNPRTLVPVRRAENARKWFGFSHCSPAVMHFHLGRSHATTNLAAFGHTLSVEGEILYEEGRLMVFDDDQLCRAIRDSGMPEAMLRNREIAIW